MTTTSMPLSCHGRHDYSHHHPRCSHPHPPLMISSQLGKYAGRLVHAVPVAEFLCGSIERQEVKRARKERAVREKDDSEVVRPDEMVDKDEDGELQRHTPRQMPHTTHQPPTQHATLHQWSSRPRSG